MSSPRFAPRDILANPERFGRAGADWTGWQHRQPVPPGNIRLPPHVVAAAAWAQHHLAVSLRLALGYPSAADPNANDQYTHADDDWLSVNTAGTALKQFADELGESRSTLTRKLSGSAVAAYTDMYQWAERAGTTVAKVLGKAGKDPTHPSG